jgi:hypothetical protein
MLHSTVISGLGLAQAPITTPGDVVGIVCAILGTVTLSVAIIFFVKEIVHEDSSKWAYKWRRKRQFPYMDTSFVMVEKPSDGSRAPYYIEDMMPGTGYHRAINVYTGEEELIRESNVIEVL